MICYSRKQLLHVGRPWLWFAIGGNLALLMNVSRGKEYHSTGQQPKFCGPLVIWIPAGITINGLLQADFIKLAISFTEHAVMAGAGLRFLPPMQS